MKDGSMRVLQYKSDQQRQRKSKEMFNRLNEFKEGHTHEVNKVRWLPNKRFVSFSQKEKKIKLWDADQKKSELYSFKKLIDCIEKEKDIIDFEVCDNFVAVLIDSDKKNLRNELVLYEV